MRLQLEGPPDPAYRALADAQARRELPRGSVRLSFGDCLERSPDQLLDLLVAEVAVHVGSRQIVKRGQAASEKTALPFARRRHRDPQLGGDIRGALAFGARQHDPRTYDEQMRDGAAPRPALRIGTLDVRQRYGGERSTHAAGTCLHARSTVRRRRNSARTDFSCVPRTQDTRPRYASGGDDHSRDRSRGHPLARLQLTARTIRFMPRLESHPCQLRAYCMPGRSSRSPRAT
jgi:hypothetical protein